MKNSTIVAHKTLPMARNVFENAQCCQRHA